MYESENTDVIFCNYWTKSASCEKRKKNDKERDTVSSDGGANDLLINVPSNDCMTLLVLLDLYKKSLKIPKLVIKSCKSYNVSK